VNDSVLDLKFACGEVKRPRLGPAGAGLDLGWRRSCCANAVMGEAA
jgi:hypothetical protein